MEFLQNPDLVHKQWMPTPYDEWANGLRGICGNFNPHARDSRKSVLGSARRIDVCGMEFAHISNDLDYVRRDRDDIRRDARENLFLILQIEGTCGVDQAGQQSVLEVGECILLDSTRPTTFFFDGRFSNHLSVHLPRQIMYADSKVDFDIARKLSASDPMTLMLGALIAKIMSTPETDSGAPHLRELVFSATRQAFISSGSRTETTASLHESATKRLHMVDVLIDRHLTEEKLSARWLATRLGISIRTLQQDFQGMGMTCTTVIRDKRLRYAHEKIRQIREHKGGGTIADVAYSAGFNDISYFNRSFRQLFDCSPTDLLRPVAAQ